jgi:hypothetical protein
MFRGDLNSFEMSSLLRSYISLKVRTSLKGVLSISFAPKHHITALISSWMYALTLLKLTVHVFVFQLLLYVNISVIALQLLALKAI